MTAAGPLAREAPYAIGLVLGASILLWSGYLDLSAAAIARGDLASFWVGARALVVGQDPFRVADWPGLARALGGPADTPVYGYPGWVAVALIPLALVPLDLAAVLWTVGGLVLAVLAVRWLLFAMTPDLPVVHTLAALTLLASQSARTAVLLGQWTFILLAALIAAVVLLRRNASGAGAASLALLAKPHLFVLTYAALLLRSLALGRARAYLVPVAAGAALLVTLSLLLMPGWPAAWVAMLAAHRLFDPPQTTTPAALLSAALGRPGIAATALLAVAIAATAFLFRPTTETGLGIWIVLSLLVAPYQWSYDQLLILPAVVLVAAGIGRRSARRATATAAAACVMLLVLGTLVAIDAARRDTETLASLVPVAALVVLVVGAWPLRHTLAAPSRHVEPEAA